VPKDGLAIELGSELIKAHATGGPGGNDDGGVAHP